MTVERPYRPPQYAVKQEKRDFHPIRSLGKEDRYDEQNEGDRKHCEHEIKQNPCHLDSLQDLESLKLFVRKGWNLFCH